MKFLPLLLLIIVTWGGLAGCASRQEAVQPSKIAPAPAAVPSATVAPAEASALARAEQIRTACIQNRRLICGRVLQVSPGGIVVDSGYTDLLRPPLGQSWVLPATVSARRDPRVLELNEPGTPCIGLVYLTDLPKRQKVKQFDYVVLIGYPAGHFVYTPVPDVKKTIRKFAAGLDSAVRLQLQDEEKNSAPPAPAG